MPDSTPLPNNPQCPGGRAPKLPRQAEDLHVAGTPSVLGVREELAIDTLGAGGKPEKAVPVGAGTEGSGPIHTGGVFGLPGSPDQVTMQMSQRGLSTLSSISGSMVVTPLPPPSMVAVAPRRISPARSPSTRRTAVKLSFSKLTETQLLPSPSVANMWSTAVLTGGVRARRASQAGGVQSLAEHRGNRY